MSERDVRIVTSPLPLVVGSGVAGLSAALALDGCRLMTSSTVGGGSSLLAQGGVAAALDPGDSAARHAEDTESVGGGLVEARLASLVTGAAREQVERWAGLGAVFDRGAGHRIALGREAGHSARRIVRAGGDATGAELIRALRRAVLAGGDIELLPETRLVDLVRRGDRIAGVLAVDGAGLPAVHLAPAVVLATGGIGGIYARTTNPAEVQGTGLAAAARHGATLADLEFVQFHPTALAATDRPAPLITEALRGEGARLIDETGRRFMVGVHPALELAPRDVLARAIWSHRANGHEVFLDATDLTTATLARRFPTVARLAAEAGIDASREPIPVAPAQHFHMGGIATDDAGRTSLAGLWAVGEVASTGLHGANRLASNSLLEAAVMGRRAARDVRRAKPGETPNGGRAELLMPAGAIDRLTSPDLAIAANLRSLAWEHLGIVRSGSGLEAALATIEQLPEPLTDAALVTRLIASAALARTESRGAHFRADHPRDGSEPARRTFVTPPSVPMVLAIAPADRTRHERTVAA